MRKTITALRVLLITASIGFAGLCSAIAFTFFASQETNRPIGQFQQAVNRSDIGQNAYKSHKTATQQPYTEGVAALPPTPIDTFYIGLPGGGSLETCLDLGGTGRTIQNIQHCGTGAAQLEVSLINETCLNVVSLAQTTTDTFCAQNCMPSGCRDMVLIFNNVSRLPRCGAISSRSLITVNTPTCDAVGCYCLADSVDINELKNNFTITDNGINYMGGYRGCNFDTIYSYTYFTVPNMGRRGPYRLDSWRFNNRDYKIPSFTTMSQLVDSMNVWDPIGNWQLDTTVFAISGGSTRNTYGQMKITRLANRAIGILELNLGIISNGIQMCFSNGGHQVVFKNNILGCSDTITVRVVCSDTASNIKPNAVDDSARTLKNRPISVTVLANDIFNGLLTTPVTLIDSARHGTATVSLNNQIVYTPQTDFCGSTDTLRYAICNATGCDTALVFIKIDCEQTTQLTAIDDRITTPKNSPLRFTPLSNDTLIGTPIVLGMVTAPRHGIIGFSGTDSLDYIPTTDYCGSDTMTYRICNNLSICDTATVFITVTCDTTQLLKPNAVDDVSTTTKNTAVMINVLGNDQVNGLLVGSVSVINLPLHGSTTYQNNEISYTPDTAYCGNDTFSYQICNANGCDTATVTVTVTCDSTQLLKPDAIADSANTKKNQAVDINVLTNDTLNGNLTSPIRIIKTPTRGTAIVSNNQITYTPNRDTCGFSDTLSYEICNLTGCDTAIITVAVTCDSTQLLKPDALADSANTKKNQAVDINVLTNDTLNGTLIAPIRIIKTPTRGTAIVSNNQITYTPNRDTCGFSDTLSYEICNITGCDTAIITVAVTCDSTQLLKPDALADSANTKKNQAVDINVLTNDALNGTLIAPIRIIKTPTRGTAIVSNNQITYTPNRDTCGFSDTLSYEICNLTGCDTAIITIAVTCDSTQLLKPDALADSANTKKNQAVDINVLANDTLNGTLIAPIRIIQTPTRGTAIVSNNQITYTPNRDTCGFSDTLSYEICNLTGCDTAIITVAVTCDSTQLLKPDALADSANTKKNQAVDINVLANDTLNGNLTNPIRIIKTPTRGTAIVSNNQITYTPNRDTCGFSDTLSYEICNITGCDTAIITIAVTCDSTQPTQRPIVAVDDNITTTKNTFLSFRPTTNDTIRTRLLTLEVVKMPHHGSASFRGLDTLVYTPANNYCGLDTLEYRICDTALTCDTGTVFVTVKCDTVSNLLPIATNDLDSTRVNTPIFITVLTNDTLNGRLVNPLSIVTQPTFGTVTVAADSTIEYQPFAGYCGGNDVFSYQICNNQGCDTATVTVKVKCDTTILRLPVAMPDVVQTRKNTAISIPILANDTINGRLDSIKIINSPLFGTAILTNNNILTYTPDSCGFTDSLIYRICNANGCDTAIVRIRVTCDTVILKPLAINDLLNTSRNRSILINVTGNDSLFSARLDTLYPLTRPSRGSVLLERDQIRYLPQTDSCDYRDTFSYVICTRGGCDTADVVVVVSCNENLPPTAEFDTARTSTERTITINVGLNDSLRGADTFRITQAAINGTAVFDTLHQVIYTPKPAFCGKDSFVYEICNRNGCDTALVFLTIDCAKPIAVDDSAKTRYNVLVAIPIVLNDTLNGTDSISVITEPTRGLVSILVDKTATYTPSRDFCGKDSFRYVICNRAGCDTAVVYIEISCGDTLIIFNGFSPNQDGRNDGFYIRGIENYPENEIIIFNRWGNQVYSKKGYRNSEAWQGTWNSLLLPDGTYYYLIYFNDGKTQPKTGYLQIMK